MKHGSVYFGGLSRGDMPPKEIPTLGAAGGRPKLSEMTMIPSTLRRQEGNDKPAMTGNDLSYCIKMLMTGGWFNDCFANTWIWYLYLGVWIQITCKTICFEAHVSCIPLCVVYLRKMGHLPTPILDDLVVFAQNRIFLHMSMGISNRNGSLFEICWKYVVLVCIR